MKSLLSSLLVQAVLMALSALPDARDYVAPAPPVEFGDLDHVEIVGDLGKMAIALTEGGELRLRFEGARVESSRDGRSLVVQVGKEVVVLEPEGDAEHTE